MILSNKREASFLDRVQLIYLTIMLAMFLLKLGAVQSDHYTQCSEALSITAVLKPARALIAPLFHLAAAAMLGRLVADHRMMKHLACRRS